MQKFKINNFYKFAEQLRYRSYDTRDGSIKILPAGELVYAAFLSLDDPWMEEHLNGLVEPFCCFLRIFSGELISLEYVDAFLLVGRRACLIK